MLLSLSACHFQENPNIQKFFIRPNANLTTKICIDMDIKSVSRTLHQIRLIRSFIHTFDCSKKKVIGFRAYMLTVNLIIYVHRCIYHKYLQRCRVINENKIRKHDIFLCFYVKVHVPLSLIDTPLNT